MTLDELVEFIATAFDPHAFQPGVIHTVTGEDARFVCRKRAREALAAIEAAGFAVGPMEATEEMTGAGEAVLMDYLAKRRSFMSTSDIFAAMIAASPLAKKD